MAVVDDILKRFVDHGDSAYGGEAVTQREHALQTATLAERAGASASLIVAALLHDLGHLLHDLPDDAPERGIDDHHENAAANYLSRCFPSEVVEPVRLHVAAKRYLCAVESTYLAQLSGPSITSLLLQGGPMSVAEVTSFQQHPHYEAAVRLRRWDDAAKDPQFQTPPLSHFTKYVHESAQLKADHDHRV